MKILFKCNIGFLLNLLVECSWQFCYDVCYSMISLKTFLTFTWLRNTWWADSPLHLRVMCSCIVMWPFFLMMKVGMKVSTSGQLRQKQQCVTHGHLDWNHISGFIYIHLTITNWITNEKYESILQLLHFGKMVDNISKSSICIYVLCAVSSKSTTHSVISLDDLWSRFKSWHKSFTAL